jgi:murein DD-endopeptidase MepM/ murein hydrolase activator NlpD
VGQLPQPEPMSGNSFRWPVQGRIVSAFGPKSDGGHNDGIDLAVPLGTSVMAAENGVIAYAGDELKGYGNLVLIRHSNNWVSAYAHNDEILVKRGDQVRRGQVIAKAGRTGQASQPQLHFELRKGSRPVDPTKYMASTQANAD